MELPYGYCGMPCALCPRYRTEGKSRCPGCSHDGYYTDVCKVHHCCRDKKLNHCGSCGDYPCVRLGKMGDFRDLDTNHVKPRTCDAVKKSGLTSWYAEYAEKADLLTEALEKYNDGRMKRYLCELFIQRDIGELREIMQRARALEGSAKEKGKAFKQIAEEYPDAQKKTDEGKRKDEKAQNYYLPAASGGSCDVACGLRKERKWRQTRHEY